MAVSNANDSVVVRDPTPGGHLSPPREVNKFEMRPTARTSTPAAKTQPVAGDGVSGGPPAPKQSRTQPYPGVH